MPAEVPRQDEGNLILRLGEAHARFWVGAMPARITIHEGQPRALGKECSTIEELETVVAQMHKELDAVLGEARRRSNATK